VALRGGTGGGWGAGGGGSEGSLGGQNSARQLEDTGLHKNQGVGREESSKGLGGAWDNQGLPLLIRILEGRFARLDGVVRQCGLRGDYEKKRHRGGGKKTGRGKKGV